MIIDKTRNGKISYNEFQQILTTPSAGDSNRPVSPGRTPTRPDPSPGRRVEAEQ